MFPKYKARRVLKIAMLCFPFSLLLTGVPMSWKALRKMLPRVQSTAPQRSVDKTRLACAFSKLPSSYEPNRGQADPSVKFLSRGTGYTLFLRQTEAVLTVPSSPVRPTGAASAQASRTLRLKMLDSSPSTRIQGQSLLRERSNYFLGNHPERRQTGIPNFARVRYKSIYRGIDMVFHGDQSQLEFDLEVAPGADVHQVRLRLDGADNLQVDSSGNLTARVDSAEFQLHRPVAYQHTGTGTRPVSGRFTLSSNREIGFRVDNYDASLPLVIDPVLSYSTFLGGTGADQALAVAVDTHGDFYVTGQTASSNFPVAGALQGTYGGITDAFVAKFKGDGSGLVYSTFLGGSFLDIAQAIAVDAQGNAYVTGFTSSTDFPTKNPLQATLNGTFAQDLFITKLSPDGSSLVYSTYLGGTGLDTIAAIALDSQDEVVLAGTTKSTDFPLVNALESNLHGTAGNSDAFVTKIKADGSGLVFSTYLGGAGVDGATGVAVDSQGNIVVSGGTNSTDFSSVNALQPAFGGGTTTNVISADGFLTKLKGDGSVILFSTYWGGSNSDQAAYLSLDASDNIILVGETNSADFPTSNQTKPPGTNITGFITKFNPDGSSVLFSTIIGGSGNDFIYGSAVDLNGNIYVSGNTSSTDLPLVNPLQSTYGGGTSDGFVSELSGNGSALLFSTYLGGSNTDGFDRMAADANGIYVAGSTSSTDFPTAGVPVNQFMGSTDGVVVKITNGSVVSLSTSSLTFADQGVGTTSPSQPVTLTNSTSAALNISNFSISPDYSQTNDCGALLAAGANCTFNITFTPTANGPRPGTLTITDDASSSPQTVSLTGTGTAPVAGVSPATLTFGNQAVSTRSVSQPVTLSNTGTAPLTINSVAINGDFTLNNNCPASVAVNASCTFDVIFSPTASGTRTGALAITDNAAGSPQTVNLTGTGTGPTAALSPASLTFGPQLDTNASTAQTVTLTNSGNAALIVTSVAISGANNGDFAQTNTCGTSVAAGANCTISVTFTPTSSGSRTASLTVTDNANGSPQTASLAGTGADFTVGAASGSTTSASVTHGQTATYSLSIAPTGGLSGNLSFACTGAPSEATCTVTPASVATNGSSATNVSVSVSTTASSVIFPHLRWTPPGSREWPARPTRNIVWLTLAMMMALALAIAWRFWTPTRTLLLLQGQVARVAHASVVITLLALLTASISCGSGGIAGSPGNPGTPAGSYNLTVTMTFTSGATTLKHNLTLTLNVQ